MKVEYINHLGTDLSVVNAARVSFDKQSDWDDYGHDWALDTGPTLSTKDQRLIKYLATHNHWTPFAHCVITLREKVPIFVARERFRHTVGFNYNEVSRRYVDSKPEFYVPDVWRKRAQDKKQGSSSESVDTMDIHYADVIAGVDEHGAFYDKVYQTVLISEEYQQYLQTVYDMYNNMLEAGVAPEQCRMILPQSMFTEYICTGSLAAFARAYKLRSDSHAQMEIQVLAKEWDRVIRPLFPHAWSSLVDEPVMECSR